MFCRGSKSHGDHYDLDFKRDYALKKKVITFQKDTSKIKLPWDTRTFSETLQYQMSPKMLHYSFTYPSCPAGQPID